MTVQKIVRTEIITRFETIDDGAPRRLSGEVRTETYARSSGAWTLRRDSHGTAPDGTPISQQEMIVGITPPYHPALENEDEQLKAALAKLTPEERVLLGL